MTRALATLCAVVALSLPYSAEATKSIGSCVQRVPVTVEVRRGDTLINIARANYDGDSSRYLDIARRNGIRNPNSIRVGQVLELPGESYELVRLVPATAIGIDQVASYCGTRNTP